MERLVFGHDGLPVIVFPTSCGRFFEFEDQGMVGAIESKINRGQMQLYCVDSVDSESWYGQVEGSWKIARHLQYERYIMNELLPHIRWRNWNQQVAMIGCSFGGFHAASMALRHPDQITAMLSMGGAFDVRRFLHGYYSEDAYLTLPMDFPAQPARPLVPGSHAAQHLRAGDRRTRHVLERQRAPRLHHASAKEFPCGWTCGAITPGTTGPGGGGCFKRTCNGCP